MFVESLHCTIVFPPLVCINILPVKLSGSVCLVLFCSVQPSISAWCSHVPLTRATLTFSLQKYSHVKLADTKDPRPFYRTKTWWCGFVLTWIGEGGNFVSYAFAPLSLIAPLNAVSVVSEYCPPIVMNP